MNGLVLTEEEIYAIYEYSLERFVDQDVIESLIATIRDRDELLKLERDISLNYRSLADRLQQQNTILREALEFYAKEDNWIGDGNIRHFDRPYGVAREVLAKVNQKEASTPDEPNRNAQTE